MSSIGKKGIHAESIPIKDPLDCSTTAKPNCLPQRPAFWNNYHTSRMGPLLSFHFIMYTSQLDLSPLRFKSSIIHFSQNKAKTLDLSNKRLHIWPLPSPTALFLFTLLSRHTEFLPELPPASGPLSMLSPRSGTSLSPPPNYPTHPT